MTLDGTGRAVGPCPIGTCNPVDICAVCRCIVTVAGQYAWHVDRALVHDAAPIVVCAWCGTSVTRATTPDGIDPRYAAAQEPCDVRT